MTEAQQILQDILNIQEKLKNPPSDIMKVHWQNKLAALKRRLADTPNCKENTAFVIDDFVPNQADQSASKAKRECEDRKTAQHFFSTNFMIDLATVTCIEYRADAVLITQIGLAQRLTVKLDWETFNRLLNAFKTFKGYDHA